MDVHRGVMVYSVGMLAKASVCTLQVRVTLASMIVLLLLCSSVLNAPAAAADKQKADSILILKKDHVMELLVGRKVIRRYKVALGQGGLGPKEREGDARTPEGHYVIDAKSDHSEYHKALHVSYPNAEDRKRAARMGVPPGGAIMIHGLPNGKGWVGARHRLLDWTLGCIG